jgi:hypothetical protein
LRVEVAERRERSSSGGRDPTRASAKSFATTCRARQREDVLLVTDLSVLKVLESKG